MAATRNETGGRGSKGNRHEVQSFFEIVKELSADISYYRVSASLRAITPKGPDDAVQDEWHTMNVWLEKKLLVGGYGLREGEGIQGARQALSNIRDTLKRGDLAHSNHLLEVLDGEIQDILDNDHGFPDKCKHWSPHRDLETLKEILGKALEYSSRDHTGTDRVMELELSLQGLRRAQIVAWISRIPHAEIHTTCSTRGPGAARGPAAWLLEPEWFAAWFGLGASSVEYIMGESSTGMTKSVSAVITQVQLDFAKAAVEDPTKTFGVAYYYCSRYAQVEYRGHEQILRSLLQQLYAPLAAVEDRSPMLQSVDASIFFGFAKKQALGFPSNMIGFSSEQCCLLLRELLKVYTRVALVLEALDECGEQTQSYLTDELHKLIKATEGLCAIRILISKNPADETQDSDVESDSDGDLTWHHDMTGQTIDLSTEIPDTQGSGIVAGGTPVDSFGWNHAWDGQTIDLVTG